jgi:hypothetical protein
MTLYLTNWHHDAQDARLEGDAAEAEVGPEGVAWDVTGEDYASG